MYAIRSYYGTGFREADPYSACVANLERCVKKGLVPILADHVSDFRSFMDRSELTLGPPREEGSYNFV